MRTLLFLAGAVMSTSATTLAQTTLRPVANVGVSARNDDPSSSTRLLRTPTVSATQIAFGYAGNIWIVPRAGGDARRLTSFAGEASNPQFSPNGQFVAFSGQYAGNTDVYVVASRGGEPKRLTWHPSADQVQGWTPDGNRVVFASGRATHAATGVPRFWTVAAAGGVEEPMAIPRANQGKISPDGRYVAYRMASSWDDERRNYRGGQNKAIWIMDTKSHDVVQVPWKDQTKEIDPVWVGTNVYWISDRDGVANVYEYNMATKGVRQLTKYADFDVKALDGGPDVLVFEQAGYVHELDPASGREHIVNISATGDFPWMMPQWKDLSNRMTNLALSATGKRAAVEARGEIFTIPAEKGDVRNMTNSSGSAERLPVWSPDGRSLAYFSDKSGEYKLYIAPQDGLIPPREITIPEPSFFYTPTWSPNGSRIGFHDSNFRMWVVDVATGTAKVVDADPYYHGDRTITPIWSPDSRYIAYPKHLASNFRALFIHDTETGQSKQVTDGLADVTSPAWDAGGKYLWFFASTDLGLNSGLLDMSAYEKQNTRTLYLMVLTKGEASPLLPESDEEVARRLAADSTASGTGRGGRAGAGAASDTTGDAIPRALRPVSVKIDFDGLQDRIIAVPGVASRDYAQLKSGVAGTVFFLEPVPASGTGGAGAGNTLHRYQLSTRRAQPFVQSAAQYTVSADGRKLLYRTGGGGGRGGGGGANAGTPGLFLVDADRAAPPQAGSGRLTVQLRALVDPKLEFGQILNEGWRNQRNNFYVRNLHGTDWPAVKKMYEPLLPYVMHRAELNYLIDMMGAELAIGHSYVRGGEMPEVPQDQGGLLGADFTIDQDRYRIAKIYDTEAWNPELRAPLFGPGINVSAGDYIVAINGVELKAPDNIHRLLDGTANRQTVIAVNSRPSLDGARNVTVVPVASEQGLRTRAWVEHNRHVVDSISGGTVAYVYIPNTGQPGYTSFNRYYFAQQDKKAAVIDERYNGGGSAADYIVDILGRTYDGYFNNPVGNRIPFSSPAEGIWGPKVMIINEMAGSGGDLMPFMFRYRKIGPLVGERTWGGLVATSDTPPFVDGGSMIAPRFGFIDREGNFAVENVGVAPDIQVENFPKEVIAGRDPQLERAVAEAMRLMKEKPSDRLMKEPVPPTWGKRRPPE
jgi:tricorn protease